jgi:hypothetical protein
VNPLLAWALRYAELGRPVFPCWPSKKNPIGPAVPHGCLDATTDPAIIAAWWTQWPSANVAVATGTPGPDVVDFDLKKGAPGAESFARLRDAGLLRGAFMVVTTPSGGWHLYFTGTRQGNGARARHGVDFRGAGGYVVAPPSYVVDDERGYAGHYAVAEHREPTGATVDWSAIRDFLDPPRPPRQYHGERAGNFDALVRWLEERPAGDRNGALYWATLRAVEGGADDAVLDQLREAIIRAGHSARDAEKTVLSAQRRAGATQ